MKKKLTLRERKIICYSIIAVSLVLFLITILTPIGSIPGLSNFLIIAPFPCIGAAVTWFAMTFRCPKCERRLPGGTIFPLVRCPHCGAKLPDMSLFKVD